MSVADWIPAGITTSLLGFALWFWRKAIGASLTQGIAHAFDRKLETLRSELRKSEELFKSELQSKSTQLEALRGGALTGMAARQLALDQRRIEAVDQLWSAVTRISPAKVASAIVASLRFDPVVKSATTNPKVREMFGALAAPYDINELYDKNAPSARPYVSDIAWALFTAYSSILSFAVFKLNIIKEGADLGSALNTESVTQLVQAALPDFSDYVKEKGADVFHTVLDLIESRLLQELRRILQGAESDEISIKQAAAILQAAARVNDDVAGCP